MFLRPSYILSSLFFLGYSLVGLGSSWGQGDPGSPRGMSPQFSIPESIKGFDEKRVKEDPVCESRSRPQIIQVEPDELKVGETAMVRGKNFGKKKECFHGASVGAQPAKVYNYVDAENVEVTVPEGVRAGLTFLNIVTGGGTARMGILVKASD